MKKTFPLTIIALLLIISALAQTAADKPILVVETQYLLPKRGMEDKFEAAVKAHNNKFHPEGQYKAGLRKVEYGEKAGWYVWVFGPTTYSALDTRPAKEGGHAADWLSTIDPLVESYGDVSLWDLNENLSYGMDLLKTSKYYEVWAVKIKRGEYYRFKGVAEKLKKTYESMGSMAFLVYDNPLHTTNGADVGLLWSFKSFDEWSKDSGTKQAFEKIYGVNSWQNMVKEWNDLIEDYNAEVRSFVK